MRLFAAIAVLALAAAPGMAQTPSFTLIDPAPGYAISTITAISADGSAAAGYSGPDTTLQPIQPGFRWTASGGRADFGLQAGLPLRTVATAISGDGQFVGGGGSSSAFRWSAGAGFQSLGGIAGWGTNIPTQMNGDGSVMSGWVQNGSSYAAYRWTGSGGFQVLPYLRTGSSYAQATGVSRDGSVVVGTSGLSSGGPFEAFRWTALGGTVALAPATGSPFDETIASGVSGDGQVIVGSGYVVSEARNHPFRWSARTGMVDLGLPIGANNADSTGANLDGTVIIGSMTLSTSGFNTLGFVWTQGVGFSNFADYLAANGVTPPAGFTDYHLLSVSDDGRTFAGYVNNATTARGFVAHVPSPGSLSLIAVSLAMTARRRRRRVAGTCAEWQ